MKKNLLQSRPSLPNIYLASFSVLVMLVLIATSFFFWDDYFRSAINKKRANLEMIISQSLKKDKDEKPEVLLSLEAKSEFEVGELVEVEIVLDTQGREVWGADLKLDFDPEIIEIKKVKTGDFFQKPLVLENSINIEEKEAWFSVGSLKPAMGKGILAIVSLRPTKEGQTSLSFSPETQVAVKGKEKSAAIDDSNLQIISK